MKRLNFRLLWGGGKTSVNKGLQGFTLAETLVTLTLIGIVATISLPGLFQHTKNM